MTWLGVPPMSEVTRILSTIAQGDPHAASQLLPLVYNELRQLAAQKLAQEKPGQTLEATALVHEAYLRLVDVEQAQHWNSRGHLLALDEALSRFGETEPAKAELVKLRFFAGMTMPEAAAALDISLATAERYWTFAKSWLYPELADDA
jgi:DNA-directed RNA polymerase specialized sigma24 family protein